MTSEVAFVENLLDLLAPRAKQERDWHCRPVPTDRLLQPIAPAGNCTTEKGVTAEEKPLEVCVKLLKPPAAHRMLVRPNDTVASIKAKLVERGVAADTSMIRLILKGKALLNERSIEECGLVSGATVHASLQKGAAPPPPPPEPTKPAVAREQPLAILQTDAFWQELEGFLRGQLPSHAAAAETLALFRNAWQTSGADP
ncbi:hypothetical protein THASP1DRAFT_28793 [Thamnocephalis sphaerospora]|uniref:Ubiquitin-like domain-containing protein n=1 Tax=Thamnocephalis sphaerospora TaxID=78915 RepID=A0A4P9XVI2_9FUNG|nr:hypothetical protein THASP1DRAFT_28793 [Thamnocephalis sphaerospora]|eukprot:RKP09420.1 hypothetical protein THASP1DRAFT_28793 [Thamnocephalis sphaerospora]